PLGRRDHRPARDARRGGEGARRRRVEPGGRGVQDRSAPDVSAAGGGRLRRCPWCGDDPLYVAYHDLEWGVPNLDERHLFEMLILEGAQAGLSWITILRKRDAYRAAFDGFDPEKIARYNAKKVRALLADPGIVRNRAKIAAAIGNAKAY